MQRLIFIIWSVKYKTPCDLWVRYRNVMEKYIADKFSFFSRVSLNGLVDGSSFKAAGLVELISGFPKSNT